MSALPVVWLCGPPGVGKSTVGWDLFTRWAAQGRTSGYIDIDQIAMRLPRGSASGAATRVKAANLAGLLQNYAAAGAQQVVVTGVASPTEAPVFENAAGHIHWVRLTAGRGELHRRFLQRNGSAEALVEIDRHADELEASNFAGRAVDTTGVTPPAVTKLIEDAIRLPDQRGESRFLGRSVARPQDDGPKVILLTGARAVGTSSVGWELFMLVQSEVPSAFVDLAQIGFLNDGSDLAVRRHPLRAANLSAMVRTYHQDGCLLVIAVGALFDARERDLYASALVPGSLSMCQLRAARSEMERRIHARAAATGGPYLAGDDLRRRPSGDVDRVLEQAYDEAERLDRADFADHVLDTTKLSAAAAARIIRDRLAPDPGQRPARRSARSRPHRPPRGPSASGTPPRRG